MARTVPDGWEVLESRGVAAAEVATLRRLAAELPDDFCVFHGVHWTRVDHGYSVFGEVDFIVVGPQGQVIVIEQKNGPLEETAEGLVKPYKDKPKNVPGQMQRSIDSLQLRFKQGHANQRLALDYLLYCPDYRVQSPATAGIAPERIVDAKRPDALSPLVIKLMAAQPPGPGVTTEAVHAFLLDELELVLDPSALAGQAKTWVTRLSGGLATWARRLEFEPFRLRVIGTAGSGKTQLALRILADAAAKGQRAQYVCFNRPLADQMVRLAPTTTTVATFHMLGDRLLRAQGTPPDFRQPGIFDRLADAFITARPSSADLLDVLIIDEGQDFSQSWADALFACVKPDGKIWWLEDPLQNLYDKPPVASPGWVTLRADINYRTPRDVLRQIGQFMNFGDRVEAAGPIEGDGIDIATYTDFASLRDATVAAIRQARKAGFKCNDIAVLTYCGRDRSALMGFDQLANFPLRRFDGTYDTAGNPVYQEGDILLETVFRFKGQSAPCIILTEIDFDVLDEQSARRLYVGATRASMQLSLIISERATARLMERLA